MNIGDFIKEKRKKENLSINQLSLYSDVSSSHISRIERGLREPSPDILKKLSKPLKTSYKELLETSGYIDKQDKTISETSDVLIKDIDSLSPESKEDLKRYLELLKIKDMQERNADCGEIKRSE